MAPFRLKKAVKIGATIKNMEETTQTELQASPYRQNIRAVGTRWTPHRAFQHQAAQNDKTATEPASGRHRRKKYAKPDGTVRGGFEKRDGKSDRARRAPHDAQLTRQRHGAGAERGPTRVRV